MTTMPTISSASINARRRFRQGNSSANVRSRGGGRCQSRGMFAVLLDARPASDWDRHRSRTAVASGRRPGAGGPRVWSPAASCAASRGRCRDRRRPADRARRPRAGSSSPEPKAMAPLTEPRGSSEAAGAPAATRVARICDSPRSASSGSRLPHRTGPAGPALPPTGGRARRASPRRRPGPGNRPPASRAAPTSARKVARKHLHLFGGLRLTPAAAACPPYRPRWPAAGTVSVSCRFKPPVVRAEPRPTAPSEAHHHDRLGKPIHQTRGDDPHHAVMPPLLPPPRWRGRAARIGSRSVRASPHTCS